MTLVRLALTIFMLRVQCLGESFYKVKQEVYYYKRSEAQVPAWGLEKLILQSHMGLIVFFYKLRIWILGKYMDI